MQEKAYNQFQWPPDLQIAKRHYQCNKPGTQIDQDSSNQPCPCCDKKHKLKPTFACRDISSDFQNLGGGVPGYFFLVRYMIIVIVILIIVKLVYSVYVLEITCPTLPSDPEDGGCAIIWGGIYVASSSIIYNQMIQMGWQAEAYAFEGLAFATYLILVLATIGIQILVQTVNKNRVSIQQKLYSRFALIIKNVPLYYELQDLKADLCSGQQQIQIVQMFHVQRCLNYENTYKRLVDLCFQIQQLQRKEAGLEVLRGKYNQYIKTYNEVETLSQTITRNTKKVIVMFNTTQQKQIVHERLRINQFRKFQHYVMKIFGKKSSDFPYFSQKLPQPQDIHWKWIGQSSTQKVKVRIINTVIVLGATVIGFIVLYYPVLYVNELKIQQQALGTIVGILMSVVVVTIYVGGGVVIGIIMPNRMPSSKLNQHYFLVMSCLILFYLFYLVSPACFYEFAPNFPASLKLKTFYIGVFTFLIIVTILSYVDVPYRLKNGRRQQLLNDPDQARKLCQKRLHEQLNHQPFPVQIRLQLVLNIWSFNAFFVFQVPYLLVFFLIILINVFCLDKHNLYNHYNIKNFISLQLLLRVQRTFIFLFLICVSLGFLVVAIWTWQKYAILGIFLVSMTANYLISQKYRQEKNVVLKDKQDIKSAVSKGQSMRAVTFRQQLTVLDLRDSFISSAPKFQSFRSIKFLDVLSQKKKSQPQPQPVPVVQNVLAFSYKSIYDAYLRQFQNQQLNGILDNKYMLIRNSRTRSQQQPRRASVSQMARMDSGIRKGLLQRNKSKVEKYAKTLKKKESSPLQGYKMQKADPHRLSLPLNQRFLGIAAPARPKKFLIPQQPQLYQISEDINEARVSNFTQVITINVNAQPNTLLKKLNAQPLSPVINLFKQFEDSPIKQESPQADFNIKISSPQKNSQKQ